MAIFTAATLATIVTAAAIASKVAVYVAFTGIALKVVGAATGNKTISKIGTYMGYAGLIGGIASAGVGALADSMSGPLLGTLSTQGVTEGSTQLASAGTDQAAKLAADAVTNVSPAVVDPNAINPVWGHTLAAQQGTLDLGTQVTAGVPDIGVSGQGFEADDYGSASSPQPETGAQVTASAAAEEAAKSSIVPPGATVTGQPAPGGVDIRAHYGGTPPPSSNLLGPQQGVSAPGGEQSWAEWWKKVDPSVKAMGGLAGGQILAGAAGGWFAGQSAEEKLAFDKQVNAQRQTEMERRIFNASNTPIVYRRNGMLQQGGA